jgi:hypothetical protein
VSSGPCATFVALRRENWRKIVQHKNLISSESMPLSLGPHGRHVANRYTLAYCGLVTFEARYRGTCVSPPDQGANCAD